MPIAVLPDVDEQRCIGCALCVEICTTLGPDVLRVKPVEGWKRGKAFVFYPERCISDGACIGVCPTKSIFWMRPMNYTADNLYLFIRTVYSLKDGQKTQHYKLYLF